MQRYTFEVQGSTLVVTDELNEGSLRITCKPFHKPDVSPVFELWNDIETAISQDRLKLSLFGISTIIERKRTVLDGEVILSSVHLRDAYLTNAKLHLVSLRQRCNIRNSTLVRVGSTRFGEVTFINCDLNHTPDELRTLTNATFMGNNIVRDYK